MNNILFDSHFDFLNRSLQDRILVFNDVVYFTTLILKKLCHQDQINPRVGARRIKEICDSKAFSLIPMSSDGMESVFDVCVYHTVTAISHFFTSADRMPQSPVFVSLNECLNLLECYKTSLDLVVPFDGWGLNWAHKLCDQHNMLETKRWMYLINDFENLRKPVDVSFEDHAARNFYASECFFTEIVESLNSGSTQFRAIDRDPVNLSVVGELIEDFNEKLDTRNPVVNVVIKNYFSATLQASLLTKISFSELEAYWIKHRIVDPQLEDFSFDEEFDQLIFTQKVPIHSSESTASKASRVRNFVHAVGYVWSVVQQLETTPVAPVTPVIVMPDQDEQSSDLPITPLNVGMGSVSVALPTQPIWFNWRIIGGFLMAAAAVAAISLSIKSNDSLDTSGSVLYRLSSNRPNRVVLSTWDIPASSVARLPLSCQKVSSRSRSTLQFTASESSSNLGVYLADLKLADFDVELLRDGYKVLIGGFCPTRDKEPFIEAAVMNKNLQGLPRAIRLNYRSMVEVLVGPYRTKVEAEKVLKRLRVHKEYQTAIVLSPVLTQ